MLAGSIPKLDAPMIRTDLETAEMVKYVDNSWHALKIGFANEIGNLCKSFSIDAHEVDEDFLPRQETQYLTRLPDAGLCFGGSCLPKDLRALAYSAKLHDLELPDYERDSAEQRNAGCPRSAVDYGERHRRDRNPGLQFKEGTDDLRESPMIEVIERLVGKGYDLRIYDKNVQVASWSAQTATSFSTASLIFPDLWSTA